MINISTKQWLAIIVAILSAMATATTQMVDIFGPTFAKSVMGAASLLSTILSSILAIISTQTALIKDVQSMPGVEKITVNGNANATLAGMAVAPENAKIEAAPGADNAVNQAAKG